MEIVQGIQDPDTRDWMLYHVFFQLDWRGAAIALLTQMNARTEDAEELAADTLRYFDQNIRRGDFRGDMNSTLKTYFLAIAKRRWFKHLERMGKPFSPLDEKMLAGSSESVESEYIDKERRAVWMEIFAKVGERCTRILELYILQQASPQEIADDLQLRGGADAGKQESGRCRKRLRALLEAHPIWKNRLKP